MLNYRTYSSTYVARFHSNTDTNCLKISKMGIADDRLVTAIVIGCGNRGENYSNFGRDFPERLKIIAVVEPLKHR